MVKFLVCLDGSKGARRAVEFAAQRAQAVGAELLLLHVVDWSPYEVLTPEQLSERPVRRQEEIDRALGEIIDPVVEEIAVEGLTLGKIVRHGHPAETVCEVIKELEVDQVFTGRRGRSRVASLLFGSVSGALVQMCPVPITVVP